MKPTKHLKPGYLIGIVVGVIVLTGLSILLIWLFFSIKRRRTINPVTFDVSVPIDSDRNKLDSLREKTASELSAHTETNMNLKIESSAMGTEED